MHGLPSGETSVKNVHDTVNGSSRSSSNILNPSIDSNKSDGVLKSSLPLIEPDPKSEMPFRGH